MNDNTQSFRFEFAQLMAVPLAMFMLAPPVVMASEPAASNSDKTTAYEDSRTPVSDSWITTKVKADFLADSDIKGLDINVSTTNGVVTLAGLLDAQAQVDKAIAIAKGTKGVKSVDSSTLKVKPVE